MKILAIDPATKCGWAYSEGGSGTWDLSVRRDESSGMRLIRLRSKLREFEGVELLVYEAARHAAPKMQGALVVQATLQGILQTHCIDAEIEYRGYSPSEIKKFATGKGNANKQMMIDSAKQAFGEIIDDNQADALWLLELAKRDYSEASQ